jgi:hypothetical protein
MTITANVDHEIVQKHKANDMTTTKVASGVKSHFRFGLAILCLPILAPASLSCGDAENKLTSLHQRFPNHLPKNRQNPSQDAQLQSTLRYLCSLLFKIHLLLNRRTANLLTKRLTRTSIPAEHTTR